jgi:hypothetical protein
VATTIVNPTLDFDASATVWDEQSQGDTFLSVYFLYSALGNQLPMLQCQKILFQELTEDNELAID